jgi:phosphonate transport system substrate-binding protein
MRQTIKVISIQSKNAVDTCRQITHYLGERLGVPAEFVEGIPWQERERLLDSGQVQVGWICGLPYVWKADRNPSPVELLAAPVMQAPRYQARPVYYSDVIVHRDSEFQSFADLRGASWAFNEPHSHSGCNLTRSHLARIGEFDGYFSTVAQAGSHLRAIELVLEGSVAASAIDSTVLELEYQTRPHLKEALRVVEVLGPSPIPPWVVSNLVPPELRVAIRNAFLGMHEDPGGKAILAAGQIAKMARVEDTDYDLIREMEALAKNTRW